MRPSCHPVLEVTATQSYDNVTVSFYFHHFIFIHSVNVFSGDQTQRDVICSCKQIPAPQLMSVVCNAEDCVSKMKQLPHKVRVAAADF